MKKYYPLLLMSILVLCFVSCQKGGEPVPQFDSAENSVVEDGGFMSKAGEVGLGFEVDSICYGNGGGRIVGGDDDEDDDGGVIGGEDKNISSGGEDDFSPGGN